MNCKQTEELLPLYAGRDLDEKPATLVAEHLQTCVACARIADEYRESVQLTEQFAPPVFSGAVYAGIRQRVLREIEPETTALAWSQVIRSLFRPRLTWAIAGVLLIVVSVFALYFIMNKANVYQQLAIQLPTNVQPGTEEHANSGPQDNRGADLRPLVSTGGDKQQLSGVRQPQRRKRFRDTLADPMDTVAAKSADATSTANSAALSKPLRVEIQTKDPMIRIIWFVRQETKPLIPGSKGS